MSDLDPSSALVSAVPLYPDYLYDHAITLICQGCGARAVTTPKGAHADGWVAPPHCLSVICCPECSPEDVLTHRCVAELAQRDRAYPPSPVPADQRLWPGEKPFTAFGQHAANELDLRVFEQDEWWVDRFGQPHRLGEMDPAYRRNLLAFLYAQAPFFHRAMVIRGVIEVFVTPAVTGVDVDLDEMLGPQIRESDSSKWMASTPLARRLHELEATAA